VPYPAKTYRRFLICIAAPSRRGTGAAAIFSHFNSGAGKSAKVADKSLPVAACLPLTASSYVLQLAINFSDLRKLRKHSI
jgi:hypothetical protein